MKVEVVEGERETKEEDGLSLGFSAGCGLRRGEKEVKGRVAGCRMIPYKYSTIIMTVIIPMPISLSMGMEWNGKGYRYLSHYC